MDVCNDNHDIPQMDANVLNNKLNLLWQDGKILIFTNFNCENCNAHLIKSKKLHREICECPYINQVRTRTSEILRLLSFNRQKKDRLISTGSMSYVKQYKKNPERKYIPQSMINKLTQKIKNGFTYKANNISYTVDSHYQDNLIKAVSIVLRGFENYITDFKFSKFQKKAIYYFLYTKFFKTNENGRWIDFPIKHYVIAAGVGSGKTFAFLTGTFIEIIFRYLQFKSDGKSSTLILYPRISLVQDQYNTCNELLDHINAISNAEINFKINILMEAAGQLKETARKLDPNQASNIMVAAKTCYQVNIFQIVMGTLETIKRRIINPNASKTLLSNLRTIIFDEIHLLCGIQGTHVVYFTRRIKTLAKKYNPRSKITFIGSSATIAEPEIFSSKIFGNISSKSIGLIDPEEDDLVSSGIFHHILLKSLKGSHLLSALTNLTSLLIHNRRNGLEYEFNKTNSKDIEKTLAFADSLSLLGRWRFLIQDNEEMTLKRLNNDNRHPFFSWFFEPLRKHNTTAKGNPINWGHDLNKICLECKRGKNLVYDLRFNIQNIRYLSNLRNSNSRVTKDVPDLGEYLTSLQDLKIGTLKNCPYFEFGCCWWFSQDNEEIHEIHRNNTGNENITAKKCPIRVIMKMSGTDDDNIIGQEIDDYYISQYKELVTYLKNDWHVRNFEERYGILHQTMSDFRDREVNLNLILASPKLEVGVDFCNVMEGIGHKSIRNLASYQQKMGRVGRELNNDAMLVTLLSFRPLDHHYYRNNFKLVSRDYIEPIPIKEINLNIIKSELYMSILDFITSEPGIPFQGSRLFAIIRSETNFSEKITGVLNFFNIDVNKEKLKKYLRGIYNNEQIINEAIEKFLYVLKIFDYDLHLVFGVNNLADLMHTKRQIPLNLQLDLLQLYDQLRGNLKSIFQFTHLLQQIPNQNDFDAIIKFKRIFDDKNNYSQFQQTYQNFSQSIRTLITEARNQQSKYQTQRVNNPNDTLISYLFSRYRRYHRYLKQLKEDAEDFEDELKVAGKNNQKQIEQIFYILVNLYQLVKEYNEIVLAGRSSANLKLSYYVDLFEHLVELKYQHPYLFPNVLFQEPTSKSVIIALPGVKRIIETSEVSIALYELLPGMWNYRFGRLYKSPVSTFINNNNLRYVSLHRVQEQYKSEYVDISTIERENFPIFFPANLRKIYDKITVFFPKKIKLTYADEQPRIHRNLLLVDDRDDLEEVQDRENLIPLNTIPSSMGSKWYDITYYGEKAFKKEIKTYVTALRANNYPPVEIDFPYIINKLFNSIKYSENFNVTEYVWKVSRSYASRDFSPIEYFFSFGDDFDELCFIGDKYTTDGIIFEVNPQTFENFWNKIIRQNNVNLKISSLLSQLTIQTLFWSINQIENINPFDAINVMKIILFQYLREFKNVNVNPAQLTNVIDDLDEDLVNVIINEITQINPNFRENSPYPYYIKNLGILLSNLNFDYILVKQVTNEIYFHTLSHKILNAAIRFSGAEEANLNYFFKVKENKIYLFDTVEGGNGNCATIINYLYIPDIEREIEREFVKIGRRILPSDDLFSEIEKELQECVYAQSSNISFDLANYANFSLNSIRFPLLFRKLIPDIKLNMENGFIDIIRSLKNRYNDLQFGDLYLVQKVPEFFMNTIQYQGNVEKFEAVIDTCSVACTECLIDTFNCNFGFLNSIDRFNKYFINFLYYDSISENQENYSIVDIDTEGFKQRGLLGEDQNVDKDPIIFYYLNQENEIEQRVLRVLKLGKFKKIFYHTSGECNEIDDQRFNITIKGNLIEKYEGASLK